MVAYIRKIHPRVHGIGSFSICWAATQSFDSKVIHIRPNDWKWPRGILPSKLQLNAVIPVNVSRLQDGLKLSLLVPHIQTLEIRQERLNRPRQPLRRRSLAAHFRPVASLAWRQADKQEPLPSCIYTTEYGNTYLARADSANRISDYLGQLFLSGCTSMCWWLPTELSCGRWYTCTSAPYATKSGWGHANEDPTRGG